MRGQAPHFGTFYDKFPFVDEKRFARKIVMLSGSALCADAPDAEEQDLFLGSSDLIKSFRVSESLCLCARPRAVA